MVCCVFAWATKCVFFLCSNYLKPHLLAILDWLVVPNNYRKHSKWVDTIQKHRICSSRQRLVCWKIVLSDMCHGELPHSKVMTTQVVLDQSVDGGLNVKPADFWAPWNLREHLNAAFNIVNLFVFICVCDCPAAVSGSLSSDLECHPWQLTQPWITLDHQLMSHAAVVMCSLSGFPTVVEWPGRGKSHLQMIYKSFIMDSDCKSKLVINGSHRY